MTSIEALADVYQGLARAGRGAGARAGDWKLRIVESSDLHDDGWLDIGSLREIGIAQGVRTERHLLRPFDVLVTARSGSVQVALVPPGVSRSVAGITLLVTRPKEPEGRACAARRVDRHGSLAMVLPDLGLWPRATSQARDRHRYS